MNDATQPPGDESGPATRTPPGHRPIRSFVRREGRLTPGQQRALERLMGRYGAPQEGMLDAGTLFGPDVPMIMDIGFGDGEALAELARRHPERGYLGVEVHRPGIGRLLQRLEEAGTQNVRVACADAVELLERRVPDQALAGLQLFFPDPWPKKRHHKRRMVQPAWAALVARRLRPGGFLHLATDWQDYAEHMVSVLEDCPALDNAAGAGRFADDPGERPVTRFERRGRRRGHAVWDLVYRRR